MSLMNITDINMLTKPNKNHKINTVEYRQQMFDSNKCMYFFK